MNKNYLKRLRYIFIILALLSIQVCKVYAQSGYNGPTIEIKRLQGEFRFDGAVDDPCWENATKFPMVMQVPVFGSPPTQKTEVFMAFDDNFVYAAGRLFDSQPEKIMATSRIRDEMQGSNDYLIIIFDSFHDHENGLTFATTPTGIRADFAILNDANDPNNPYNKNWNTFWDVKTTRNKTGWFAEIRIPLSSLRFQTKSGDVTMGLVVFRYLPRDKAEYYFFPAFPDKWGNLSWLKISQGGHVVFRGVKSKKPVYIAPYAIAGLNQESKLNRAKTGRDLISDSKINAGLDVKYGLTQNLTMDFSLNTDFADVEADKAQINLTRFGLFFPEKRNFFLERSSNFSFAFDENNNLFHSRRIGLANDQYPVQIYGGARLVGRAGKWDIGLLDMQTHSYEHPDNSASNLPSENFGVVRLRRQVINGNSYVGGILTSRIGTKGSNNTAYGLDGIFCIKNSNYLDIKWVQTFDDSFKNKINTFDNSRVWLDLRNRKQTGFGYDFWAGHAGNKYLPECGFEQRSDFNQIGTKLLYGWLMKPESKFYNQRFTIDGKLWSENRTNLIQTSLITAGYEFTLKSNAAFIFQLNRSKENITKSFSILRTGNVPAGTYIYNYTSISFNTSYAKNLYMESKIRFGQYCDGNLVSLYFWGRYNLGSGFKVEGSYEFDKVKFSVRNEAGTGHIASLKPQFMFSTKLSFIAYLQYNSSSNSVLTNLRFRYNPGEGNDFYIVFNEGRNTVLDEVIPPLHPIAARSIMLKYTYTFVL